MGLCVCVCVCVYVCVCRGAWEQVARGRAENELLYKECLGASAIKLTSSSKGIREYVHGCKREREKERARKKRASMKARERERERETVQKKGNIHPVCSQEQ